MVHLIAFTIFQYFKIIIKIAFKTNKIRPEKALRQNTAEKHLGLFKIFVACKQLAVWCIEQFVVIFRFSWIFFQQFTLCSGNG